MLSPGPLASAHQELDGNCDACHMSFAGVPNERCLSCHEGLAARITSGKGFHASLAEECIACHGDHGGRSSSLSKAEATASFDHAKTGFTLVGSHEGVSCETCHDKPVHEMAGSCSDCHTDPHDSALGPACTSCHETVAWQGGLKALSAHLLSMEGKHGEQQCNDCHLHGDNLAGDAPCSNCHEDTHGGTVALCSQCHEVTGFKPAGFDHGPCTCAFPGKHQTVECLDCHEDFKFTETPIVCSGCHVDQRPHDPVGECSSCHTATSWVDNRFDHNRQASFKIEGAHEAVACVQCHTDGTFRGVSTTCTGCHEATGSEAHGDFSSHGGCESCHVVAGFKPSTFDHASTGFAIDGKHGTLSCPACHEAKVDGYPGKTP